MSGRFTFFGAYIDPLTMDQTLEKIEEIISNKTPVQHVVVNVAKLVMMQKDEALRGIVNSCGLINADGQGIVWGARLLGLKVPERVAGIDLMINLVERAAEKGYRIYLLGAEKEIIMRVEEIWRDKYPCLQIAGSQDGYFTEEQEAGVVGNIRNSAADILFVAMGSPKKEIFLNKYLKSLNVPFVMGVGGSFDVVAGKTKRSPRWMQKAGLEWFYRFLCEPWRLWKRYFVTNSIYALMLLKSLLNRERYAKVIES